ncbi:hypothetical protein [Streptomyces broussonetiae]|uniref:Integral membrane protein n=1 Tax=Streptomyces broussonetiae TaxID=2686304 RepID=A0ABV5E8G3_9ACTN
MVLVVLGVLVVAIVVTGLLVGRRPAPPGFGGEPAVVRQFHGRGRGGRLGGVAAFAGLSAALMYVWGMLFVGMAVLDAEDGGTGSSPMGSCRLGDSPEETHRWMQAVDYDVSWLPLGFECVTSDGERYDSGQVPSYVNPVAFGLALVGVGCAVAAGYRGEVRVRREAGGQEGGGGFPS